MRIACTVVKKYQFINYVFIYHSVLWGKYVLASECNSEEKYWLYTALDIKVIDMLQWIVMKSRIVEEKQVVI